MRNRVVPKCKSPLKMSNYNLKQGGSILSKLDLRPPSPITFWKSPYARDRQSIFKNNSLPRAFVRPKVTSVPTKYDRRVSSTEEKVVVKSILKQSAKQETRFEQNGVGDESSPRIFYGQPNLITTGTGSGRPHGVTERSTSAEKRVKFDRLPMSGRVSGSGSFKGGRKLNSKRHVPGIRQLGSGLLNYRTPDKYSTVVSLSGGETQIKFQIEEFIKKLRMSENNKHAKMSDVKDAKESRNSTPSKLRKTRALGTSRYFHDWKEFDLDNTSFANAEGSDQDLKDAEVTTSQDKQNKQQENQGSDNLSDHDSLSSTTLNFYEKDLKDEKSKSAKSKPNAVLNTKYRHITMNEVNLHKYDDRYQNLVLGRDPKRLDSGVSGNARLSFCNPQKANDIIGWLADVENAKVK